MSGTNTRVSEEEELITINIDSSEQSRAQLQLQPRTWALPRPTSGGGLHLARPLRASSTSVDLPRAGSASSDTEAAGSASHDL